MKKIFNIISLVILAILLLVAGFVTLSAFNTPLKIRLFSVQSGSMEPAIPLGSLVVVAPTNEYKVGDVITFRSERSAKETATHRVVEVVKDEELNKVSYKTKGDTNNNIDGEAIVASRVVGKVNLTIPLLGYILSFAQTQIGFVALIVIPATILIYSEVQSIKNEIIKMYKRRRGNNELDTSEELLALEKEEIKEKKHAKRKTKKS